MVVFPPGRTGQTTTTTRRRKTTDIQPRHATGSFGGREVVNFVGPEAERIYFGTDFASTFQESFTAFYLVAPEDGQPSGDRIIFRGGRG